MEIHADELTARHFRVTSDWHEANDSRGKTQGWRSWANKTYMKYLIEEYMPWAVTSEGYDFSFIDINR